MVVLKVIMDWSINLYLVEASRFKHSRWFCEVNLEIICKTLRYFSVNMQENIACTNMNGHGQSRFCRTIEVRAP